VLALTPLFTNLPEAVLAAMIIHAVSHLMKVAEMRRFYRLVPREFWLGMITPFRDTVTQLVSSSPEAIHTLILDLDANDELDITSSEALEKLLDELGGRHVRIGLAHVHATTAEMMRREGILDRVGTDHIFPNLEIAVTWASTAVGN
jgi:MFS superfamily sulfate permease-like transporter